METIEGLKRKIQSTEDLRSVVKTMKSLAAVKIRQYEKAVDALKDYNRTVEMGLRVVVQRGHELGKKGPLESSSRLGAVIFGSDQGMCGQLNDQMVTHAMKSMEDRKVSVGRRKVLAVGLRVSSILYAQGQPVEETFTSPSSVNGITAKVQELLLKIQAWTDVQGLDQIFLFHARPASKAAYRPHSVRLLPVDRQWLKAMREKPWPTRMLPIFTMNRERLFKALIQQYLFVSLFRAIAESSASENASRLASMQGAEKNIGEQLAELTGRYNRQRQMNITEELLDIVSGFEALKNRP